LKAIINHHDSSIENKKRKWVPILLQSHSFQPISLHSKKPPGRLQNKSIAVQFRSKEQLSNISCKARGAQSIKPRKMM